MRYLIASMAGVALLVTTLSAFAGEGCKHCGCKSGVQKVCRLTVETKKVPEVKYSYECEDFCVPGPSKQTGCTCERDCKGCEKCKPIMAPQCAEVYTRTKLVKKTTEKEEKVYKWVVETVCAPCASRCQAETTQNKNAMAAAK